MSLDVSEMVAEVKRPKPREWGYMMPGYCTVLAYRAEVADAFMDQQAALIAEKDAEIAELKEALAALKAENQWVDVKDAPRSSELVEMRFADGTIATGRYWPSMLVWDYELPSTRRMVEIPPTHYRPLPSPPTTQAATEGE